MKNKILIIFFMSFILLYFIYRCFFIENNYILIFGEKDILNYIDKNDNINLFLYDRISYKEMNKSILNNDKIIVKDKKIYLNQLIHSSKYVIVYNNSFCYNNELVKYNIDSLISKISKISNAKIYIVENECNNSLDSNEKFNFISLNDLNDLIGR